MDLLLFAKNVKYLRELNGWTLTEMEAQSGFKRSTWSGYENGKSYPTFTDLIKISEKFGVSETDLLHADLQNVQLTDSENKGEKRENVQAIVQGNVQGNEKLYTYDEAKKAILNEPKTPYNVPRIPAVVTVDQSGVDNIIYVPVKAQAGYLIGYSDQEYIANLPSMRMPGLNNGTYRMFEVEGLSMSPTLSDRDRVICQWCPSIAEIRENRVHVVVLKDGVCIKRVLNRVKEREVIYLVSDTITHRADYPLKEVHTEDILEIWRVVLKVSSDLSDPSEMHRKVADMEININEIMKKLNLRK